MEMEAAVVIVLEQDSSVSSDSSSSPVLSMYSTQLIYWYSAEDCLCNYLQCASDGIRGANLNYNPSHVQKLGMTISFDPYFF